MLHYNVIFLTSENKEHELEIAIDEYNNFSYEVVDILNAVIKAMKVTDIKEVIAIDYLGSDDDEEVE